MNAIVDGLGSSSGGPGGLDLFLKSAILIALALGARRILGRRARLGSAAGHAGLVALLALPVANRLGPPLVVRLPAAGANTPGPIEPPSTPEPDRFDLDPSRFATGAGVVVEAGPAAVAVPARSSGPIIAQAPPTPTPVPARPTDWAAVAAGAYLAVASLLLAKLAVSLGAVARLVRRSVAVDDPAWLEALERIRARLGIARPVGLAWSTRVGVPVVVGWRRATILLPVEAAGGTPGGHVEAILIHELAHVRRGDYAWNILARLVEAIYWPQPLAWLLGRAVAESRELACDSFCVGLLGGPAGYREALIATAEGLIRRPGPALGLAIAGRSRLGRRVAAIDRDPGDSRCLAPRAVRVALAASAVLLAAALGPGRVTRAEPQAAPAPIPAPAPSGPRTLRLRVVSAATGRPVPHAEVRVWMALRDDDWRTADAEGRLAIVHSTGPADRTVGVDAWSDGFAMQRHNWGQDPKLPIPDEATLKLQAGESLGGIVRDEAGRPVAGAKVYLWSHNYKRKDPTELLYDLRSTTGPDGRWHTGGAPETTGDLLGFYITHPDYLSDREYVSGRARPPIADFRAGKAESVLKTGVPIVGRVVDPAGRGVPGALVISTDQPGNLFSGLEKYGVRTDPDGNFRTGQVKPGDWHLVVRASGFGPAALAIKVRGDAPHFESRPVRAGSVAGREDVDAGLVAASVEIQLPKAVRFVARVVEPSGRPIEGAFVNIDTWRGYRCLGVFLYSDADGRARWDDGPEDALTINADRTGYRGLSMVRATAGNGEVALTLLPSLSISGTVRDSETRKAVAGARFEYGACDPKSGEVATWEKPPELGPTTLYQWQLSANFPVTADTYRFRITAEGYLPFTSRIFESKERVVTGYDVSLVPGSPAGPRATATRPDGRPLAGATVHRISTDERSQPAEPGADARMVKTSADGTFAIPQGNGADVVLIRGDGSYGLATIKELAGSPAIATRPYGRIEGRYVVGDRPAANRPVELEGRISFGPSRSRAYYRSETATTDADGRFAFERIIPAPDLRISPGRRPEEPGGPWSAGLPVRVEEGRTTTFTLGGTGRAVVGRVAQPEGRDRSVDFSRRSSFAIETDRTNSPIPLDLLRGRTSLAQPGWSDWLTAYPATPAERAYTEGRVAMSIDLAADGSFRIDDVPPGFYRFSIRVNRQRFGGPAAPEFEVISRPLVVSGGWADGPIVLDDLRPRPRVTLKAGDPAPRFEVVSTEGRTLTVPDDFRGRFLLLDFGTLWDDQSRLQLVRMNGVAARFGKDVRFAMLSLILAADGDEARRFVAEKGQAWPQAIVGPLNNPIASSCGIDDDDVPATVLIGPDGRVIATDRGNFRNEEAIARAMSLPETPPPAPAPPRPAGEPRRDPIVPR